MALFNAGISIILERDSKVLLGQRSAHRFAGGMWEFPAGRIEPSELIEDAVIREAKEELGVNVKPIQLINAYIFTRENEPFILLNYYCEFTGEIQISDEHKELRWLSFEDASQLLGFEEQKATLAQFLRNRELLGSVDR